MAPLFDETSQEFLEYLLKQVSCDYKIDFNDMKKRYMTQPPVEDNDVLFRNILQRHVVEETVVPLSKMKKTVEFVVPLSKMKKSDLVKECTSLGMSTSGSVVELKNRIKKKRVASGIKTTRGNSKKKIKKIIPVHNHKICTDLRPDCPLCQSHGNVMCKSVIEYEMIN